MTYESMKFGPWYEEYKEVQKILKRRSENHSRADRAKKLAEFFDAPVAHYLTLDDSELEVLEIQAILKGAVYYE